MSDELKAVFSIRVHPFRVQHFLCLCFSWLSLRRRRRRKKTARDCPSGRTASGATSTTLRSGHQAAVWAPGNLRRTAYVRMEPSRPNDQTGRIVLTCSRLISRKLFRGLAPSDGGANPRRGLLIRPKVSIARISTPSKFETARRSCWLIANKLRGHDRKEDYQAAVK